MKDASELQDVASNLAHELEGILKKRLSDSNLDGRDGLLLGVMTVRMLSAGWENVMSMIALSGVEVSHGKESAAKSGPEHTPGTEWGHKDPNPKGN